MSGAISYCDTLNAGGNSNWRLLTTGSSPISTGAATEPGPYRKLRDADDRRFHVRVQRDRRSLRLRALQELGIAIHAHGYWAAGLGQCQVQVGWGGGYWTSTHGSINWMGFDPKAKNDLYITTSDNSNEQVRCVTTNTN